MRRFLAGVAVTLATLHTVPTSVLEGVVVAGAVFAGLLIVRGATT